MQFLSFLTLAAMSVLLVGLLKYVAFPRRMTVWEYHAGPERVRLWSLAAAVLLAADAIAAAVFLALCPDAGRSGDLICMAGYLVASLAMITIRRMEARSVCVTTPSDYEPPRGGTYIGQ